MNKEDYLAHWGIKGMKWGVRRFQNRDGTRTQAGNARRKNRTYSSDYEKSKSLRKKKASELSNEELRQLNDRMRLEMQYKDLNQSTISKGSKRVGKILQNSGNTIALAYATAYGFKVAKKILGTIPS